VEAHGTYTHTLSLSLSLSPEMSDTKTMHAFMTGHGRNNSGLESGDEDSDRVSEASAT